MHYHHTAAGYRAEDARTQHLQRPTGRRPSITSSYPICTAVLQKRVCHPANETAKCSMCSSKCTVALARAPKTLRMKSADTPIDINPFACPTRLCRTFCLFLRHTLMLVVQAGSAHSSVIPKRLLRLCRSLQTAQLTVCLGHTVYAGTNASKFVNSPPAPAHRKTHTQWVLG